MKKAVCIRPLVGSPFPLTKGETYFLKPSTYSAGFVEVYDKLGNRLGGKEDEFLADRFKLLTDRKGLDHYA